MNKKGTFRIIPEKPLIVEYYNGDITIDDLKYFKKEINKEENYDLYTNYIIDFRDCVLKIEIDQLQGFIDFLSSAFKHNGTRNVAYLTSKPNHVVLTTIYKHLIAGSNLAFRPKIFSTTKATVEVFEPNLITENELDDLIKELKKMDMNIFG